MRPWSVDGKSVHAKCPAPAKSTKYFGVGDAS
jgi:hypothetical protein